MVFNATFNNISVISWWSVLLVEETGVPGENHWHVTSHWQNLSHGIILYRVHLAMNGGSGIQVYAYSQTYLNKIPFGPTFLCLENTGALIIQIILQRFLTLGFYLQDSDLFRVQFSQASLHCTFIYMYM
jgi:hypothetical protein